MVRIHYSERYIAHYQSENDTIYLHPDLKRIPKLREYLVAHELEHKRLHSFGKRIHWRHELKSALNLIMAARLMLFLYPNQKPG